MVESRYTNAQSRAIRPDDSRGYDAASKRRQQEPRPDAIQAARAGSEFQPRIPRKDEIAALKGENGELDLPKTYRRGRYLDVLA